MRIRFNISPISATEVALIALINNYPDGLRSELVRRLIATGYRLHSVDVDILSGINIHAENGAGGIMCKFNVSPFVPAHDPAVIAFQTAKSLNSLVKPLYLNKLIKAGYLFETGQMQKPCISIPSTETSLVATSEPRIVSDHQLVTEPMSQNVQISSSLKLNTGIRNSLKNLAN